MILAATPSPLIFAPEFELDPESSSLAGGVGSVVSVREGGGAIAAPPPPPEAVEI